MPALAPIETVGVVLRAQAAHACMCQKRAIYLSWLGRDVRGPGLS